MTDLARSHFILYVSDQEASRRFYEHVLGQPPSLHVPGMTEFRLGAETILGLMPEQGIARLLQLDPAAIPTKGGLRGEVYLVVSTPEAYHQRAREAGGRELSPYALRDWGDWAAYSRDPDGYVLVFAGPDRLARGAVS